MKILAVDDHPLIREALQQVLLRLDPALVLLEAEDCPGALEQVRRNPDVAVILLDLSLPGVSGFDALNHLREEHPEIPVVVLSAHDDRNTVTRALDHGAMGFVPKTASPQIMLGALRLVLSGGVYLPPSVLTGDLAPQPATLPAGDAGISPSELGLTERQSDVLALLVQGKPNKLICRDLNLAEGTVKIHVTAILKALNVSNRTQAVIEVGRRGIRLNPVRAGAVRP